MWIVGAGKEGCSLRAARSLSRARASHYEPNGASHAGFDPRLRSAIMQLQAARDLAALSCVTATAVRELTGFDRVMVYRFDADWNGHVVAESRRADLEPFLGLHYPASDIPVQARRLYTQNWIRLIADDSRDLLVLVLRGAGAQVHP